MNRQRFSPADAVLTSADDFSVTDNKPTSSDNNHATAARKSPLVTRSSACSDYFSDSGSKKAVLPTSPDVIDFSEQCPTSPLLDFGRKERDYISKVIQIACQRTSLLRKNKFLSVHSGKSLSRKLD